MQNRKKDYVLIGLVIVLFLLVGIAIGLAVKDNTYQEKNDAKVSESESKTEIKKADDTEEKDKAEVSTDKKEKNESITTKTENKEQNKLQNNVNTEPKKEEVPKTNNTVVTYSDADNLVIESLNNTLTKVEKSKNTKSFATSAKATFVSIVDFLFYDGTIKGVTFKELTNAGKSKVLELASKIDNAIEKRLPGYKESIANDTSKAFNKASSLIKKGATNLDSFMQNRLEESEYNSLIEAKDELKQYTKNAISFVSGVGSNLFSKAKDKASSWYQEWKNK